MLKPNDIYYMYLRKSREDLEAEERGTGETLARHEAQLRELAEKLNIKIAWVYREVVSGETIAARPEMIAMLNDIETYRPAGVLVTEIPRLARGDTRDQGLIMETFKYAGTHIITPMKIYDPNNEFDEEYAEFGLFMSRREYANINRRLQNGKIASVKEGKYVGSQVPFGYERYKLKGEKGSSLRPHPEQAPVVKLIYEMYINGTPESGNKPVSATSIARILNEMGVPSHTGRKWRHGVVREILTNTTYIGMVHWGRRKLIKTTKNGVVQKTSPIQSDYLLVQGKHEPLIDKKTWEAAQAAFAGRSKPLPSKMLQNSFAGILFCSECGYSMKRRPRRKGERKDWIICRTTGCPTCGAEYGLLEDRIIESLSEWLKDLKVESDALQPKSSVVGLDVLNAALASKSAELAALEKQLGKTFTLLETEVYTPQMFHERHTAINESMDILKSEIAGLEKRIESYKNIEEQKQVIIPKCEYLLTHYYELSPEDRNHLLKQIIHRIDYYKTERGTKKVCVDFRLKMYPLTF